MTHDLTVHRRVFIGAAGAALAWPMLARPSLVMADYLRAECKGHPEKARFPVGDSYVVANLYRPRGPREHKLPAVVIAGSLTAVKEQMGGIYAIALAKRGFIALSIDYRNYGESGGQARQYEDPASKTADLIAATSFLAEHPDVDPTRLALLGICTSGGTALYAAARDARVGAVACVASHLAEPAITPTLYGGDEGVAERRAAGREARERFERTGENQLILAYSDVDQTSSHPGPNEYYMDPTRGGGVEAWQNQFAVMSWNPWLDFDPVSEAAKVTTPTLIVHSDECALPDQARKVYDLLAGPKTLHWTTGPHFEFYDGVEKVHDAVEAVSAHYQAHLG
ncbi:MAG: CocE/NonD family hydrolase [Polyangiales bacterium]